MTSRTSTPAGVPRLRSSNTTAASRPLAASSRMEGMPTGFRMRAASSSPVRGRRSSAGIRYSVTVQSSGSSRVTEAAGSSLQAFCHRRQV